MKPNSQPQSQSPVESKPEPEFIAQQLRKPSGNFAPKIGLMMNQVNKPLYDLVFDVMELQKGDKILEIGLGNGRFFEQLFSKESELQVSGIDFSEAMVEAATKYNQDSISASKLNLKLGNSDAIPFADQTFDTVFCNMVIYFWDQPERHLKEVYRVLKPGGTFYTGMRSREGMLRFPFVKFGFNLYSAKEWEEILVENGFLSIDTHKKLDPEIEAGGNQVRLESCCIIAEKEARSSK